MSTLRDAALQILQIDEHKVHVVLVKDAVSVKSMKRSILFIWATWSAKARLALYTLGKALHKFQDLDDLELCIMDNDSEAASNFLASIDETANGYGETYWIRDGLIKAKHSKYAENDISILENNICELLYE